jgi:sulfate adenylyltransferase
MIHPHRGKLINQVLNNNEKKSVLGKEDQYKKIYLDSELVKDVKNIGKGAFSPLKGFLYKKDFQSVCEKMRLSDDTVWPIPIVLDLDKNQVDKIGRENQVLLYDQQKKPLAVLKNIEVYQYDKEKYLQQVFKTKDQKHPGVEEVCKQGDYLAGGEIFLINNSKKVFPKYNLTPLQTRKLFKKRGWKTVGAFQTRNVPHRGHEFLQLQTLKQTDGLFVQPVIGRKKLEDFKDEYIIGSYQLLINNYHPKNKVVLGVLPLKMRYAGPREAVLHAIIRKNFGCTHFIVGRDHAGAGNFYQPYAAQKIFDQFDDDELGVEILKFAEVIYRPYQKVHDFVSEENKDDRIYFSGTKIREMIKTQRKPPEYLMRPEVYNLLTNSYNTLVDKMYKNKNNNKKGFVLWFTGLSQSGKTTIADAVQQHLKENGVTTERLDGDIVRESLTKDLGFTKEDRNENIRRVGFVAQMLSKNGVGVIASFISPYQEERDNLRNTVNNYIEVFVNTPLEVCERRDTKGLYAKARRGEIKNFTGISDPYQEPENPDIEVFPAKDPLEKSVKKVLSYLEENNYI